MTISIYQQYDILELFETNTYKNHIYNLIYTILQFNIKRLQKLLINNEN